MSRAKTDFIINIQLWDHDVLAIQHNVKHLKTIIAISNSARHSHRYNVTISHERSGERNGKRDAYLQTAVREVHLAELQHHHIVTVLHDGYVVTERGVRIPLGLVQYLIVGLDALYGQLLAVVRLGADPVEVPLVQYAVAVYVRVAARVHREYHVLLVQAPARRHVGAQQQERLDQQRPPHLDFRRASGHCVDWTPPDTSVVRGVVVSRLADRQANTTSRIIPAAAVVSGRC